MRVRWDPLKSGWLKRTRGVSFEDLADAPLIAIEEHPNRPNQKVYFFELNGYVWAVPFVRDGDGVFLKTMYPTRKHTQRWIRGELK